MNEKYKEIINMPHPVSKKHAQMDRLDRAAQFAPYSALSGYEDSVEETARLTDQKIELDDYEKERINATLTHLLADPLDKRVSITFFRPDNHKEGGAFITVTGSIDKYDEAKKEISLIGGAPIGINDIVDVIELKL